MPGDTILVSFIFIHIRGDVPLVLVFLNDGGDWSIKRVTTAWADRSDTTTLVSQRRTLFWGHPLHIDSWFVWIRR